MSNLFCLLTGKVFTLKDAWVIGDEFLKEIFDTLTALRNKAHEQGHTKPYIYDFYNVNCIWTNPLSTYPRNMMAYILNCFIAAITEKDKDKEKPLSKLVLVITD